MNTLAATEEILRECATPMTVREIVLRSRGRLPSRSKTPDTVVARDLSLDIKRKGEASRFVRASPGRYTMRDLLVRAAVTPVGAPAEQLVARLATFPTKRAAPAEIRSVGSKAGALEE